MAPSRRGDEAVGDGGPARSQHVDLVLLTLNQARLVDTVAGEAVKSRKRSEFCLANDNCLAALLIGFCIVGEKTDAHIGIRLNVKLTA